MYGAQRYRHIGRKTGLVSTEKNFVPRPVLFKLGYVWIDWKWSSLFIYKNKARHAVHTIVSWSNPKQWLMVHTSDSMITIPLITHTVTIFTREIGKLKTHSPILSIHVMLLAPNFTNTPTCWKMMNAWIFGTDVIIFHHGYAIWEYFHQTSRSLWTCNPHCSDVIINTMGSQITGLLIVCSAVWSSLDQGKLQSSTSLAFVRGIYWWPEESPNNGPVTRKCSYLMTSSSRDLLPFHLVYPYAIAQYDGNYEPC